MTDRIRRRKDGTVLFALESSPGFPALHMAHREMGERNVQHVPAEMLDATSLDGDLIVVVSRNSKAAANIARVLNCRLATVAPSGYRIECLEHRGGRALLVAGGDLFGMLAGLAEMFLWGECTSTGYLYRGGTRSEKPAFPLRYYWTWDHSTNWVLDDPGNQFFGCHNQYAKRPETFLEDYRRLVEHCIAMRFNGIVIWGFLRDSHGGERYASELARYASERGVAILPGVGTTWYGGIYYQGNHPCNLETYLRKHPERGMMKQDGTFHEHGLSPYHPENIRYIQESLQWLYRSFAIGGVNLENGDLLVDYSPAALRMREKIHSGEADFFKDQFFAYKSALEVAHRLAPNAWNTYATYSGFGRGRDVTNAGADMGAEPYFARRMPPSAIAQWTLTGMLRTDPVPLADWLRSSRPEAVYNNPRWPRALRPPTPRSAGFIHQASQWHSGLTRADVAISTFAEACLRSHESGLEGISIHGEATSRTLTWLLNYLTMRHWTYHPVSTLEEFAAAELAPRLGGQAEARAFIHALLLLEQNKPEEAYKMASKHWHEHLLTKRPDPFEIASQQLQVANAWEQVVRWCALRNRPQRWATGFNDIV